MARRILSAVLAVMIAGVTGCSSMGGTSSTAQTRGELLEVCPLAQDTYLLERVVASDISGSVFVDGHSVVGNETTMPLAHVVVVLFSGLYTRPDVVHRAVTAEDGSFIFGRLDSGDYTLLTCMPGFDAVEVPVTIEENQPAASLVLELPPS